MSETIPPGFQLPNPNDDRGPLLRRIVWVLLSLSCVVVACRLWTKIRKTRRLYWDDGIITLALGLGIVHVLAVNDAVNHGLGRHLLDLTANQREATIRIGLFSLGWAFLSPMTGRIGFCVTLFFLTGTDPKVRKWPIWVFIILQLLVNISAVVVFYTQCGSQIDIFWTPSMQPQDLSHCENPKIQTYYGYFQGSFNTLTDVFLTILPGVLIKHTRLSIKTKIGLAFLLCLSIIAMVASIVKTYEAKRLSEIADFTYEMSDYVIWMSVELNVVIIVASIPLLRPLFRRNHPRDGTRPAQRWDNSTLGSVFSKGGRAHLSRVDSEENIIRPPPNSYRLERPGNIQITTEVSVTYELSDLPFVHAALVGLVEGEIANPHLVQR